MKFNLKGLNLNMLLLVAILVGVLVVFLRQNNKCVMDEGVEGFGWRNSYKNFFAKMRRQQEQLETKIRKAQQIANNNTNSERQARPMFGTRQSPFATFRDVKVNGFAQLGTTTWDPLETVLTACHNHNECQGVMTRGNKKFLIKNTDMSRTYTVSEDGRYNSYIRWNAWMEGDAGYNTMMKLPDGSTRGMNWDTFTTV
jgi:hypothetical protein